MILADYRKKLRRIFVKFSQRHVSIVIAIGDFWIFNFYWEPKLFRESIHYGYPNKMGLWFVLLDHWVV